MSKNFNINSKEYCRRYYTCSELAERILPSMYGTAIKDITYEQLLFIKTVLNDGWELLPGFYGEKTDKGTMLKPNLSWFKFTGGLLNEDKTSGVTHMYVMCVNYSKFEISLYDFEHLIGTFPSYADILQCTGYDRFSGMIPIRYIGYNKPFVLENVEGFERQHCIFDEIYQPKNKVYENMENDKLTFEPNLYQLEQIEDICDYKKIKID